MIIQQLNDVFKIIPKGEKFDVKLNRDYPDQVILNKVISDVAFKGKCDIFRVTEIVDKELVDPKTLERLEKINSVQVVYSIISTGPIMKAIDRNGHLITVNSQEMIIRGPIPQRLIFTDRSQRDAFRRDFTYLNSRNEVLSDQIDQFNIIDSRNIDLEGMLESPKSLLDEMNKVMNAKSIKEIRSLKQSDSSETELDGSSHSQTERVSSKSDGLKQIGNARDSKANKVTTKDRSKIIIFPD